MKLSSTNTLNENTNDNNTKENLKKNNNEQPKVKFNLLDINNKRDFSTLKSKLSVKSSNKRDISPLKSKLTVNSMHKNKINLTTLKSKLSVKSSKHKTKNNLAKVNSRLNSNNHEPKEKLKKLSKSHLNLYDAPSSKSSLNLLNNLPTTFITKAKLAKTKSQYETNNDSNFHKKTKMQQTKNNFLKLITKVNEGNSVKEYNNSKYSLLYNKKFYDVYEGDSLEKVEQRLKSKIMNMEKEAEFMEFEIGPLDISINRINFKKKKRKIGSKRTKDFDKKKYERNKKFINTAAIHKKQMLSQITSSNSYNVNSENILMTRSNQYLDDSSSKLNVNEKNNISSNVNFSGKFKLSSPGKMKSKYKSEKASNNYASNNISSKINSNNINSKINIHDKLTKIFKTKELKLDLPNKETILSKSKTYSNLDSKIGQTVIDNTGSIDEINGLSSEKEVFIIDKEKFRVLVHKKLVYDSLDDEELIEDAVVENFYFDPNSYTVIVVDAMVLILTFWSLIYKPLYLVLNNCDVKNTITSLTFNNISNIFIDALFIFDLIINFFKSYYNFEEQLVTKSNQIFFHYIKRFFFVDLISAIPYYSIIKFIALNRYQKYGISPNCSEFYNHQINDGFQVIEILKLFKILKCISRTNIVTNYILNELNSYTFFENWSFLIFNTCFFLLLLHLTACIHIFISCTAYPNWIVLKNLNFSSFPTIYLSSIYFLLTTVTSVGYGDIIGSTFTEFCFQIVILLVGIIAYSWLISSISNYVKEKNKQNEIFLQKISMLNEIKLEHPNMTKELYDKIYLHLEYINLKQKKDKSALIDSLPQTVTKSLLYEMYRPIIENFNFFKNFKNSEFINRVISKLKPIIAVKNDLLLDQGEIFEETFFVKQGRLSLEVKIDAIHPEKSVEKLMDEEYFFGIENNELYQKNAFGLMNLTTIKQTSYPTAINQKNLYNLYSKNTFNMINLNKKNEKSVHTNEQGKIVIKKHQNTNSDFIYLKILDIRKNEHFGALLMFLNKRSPLSLRVKTKKAELYFLKKIDAIEISSSYPNIWKRVNKASFHNLKQIKKIMHKIIKHFCETYGINFMKKICDENEVKDINDLKKIYTLQNKLTKDYYNNNKFTVLNNNINAISKRFSAIASKSQLKMLKEFINNNSTILSKPYEEKHIAHADIKDFDVDNIDNDSPNEKSKDISMSKKAESSFDNESPMNCTLNMIKIKDKNHPFQDKSALIVVNNKENTQNNNRKNNYSSEESKSISKETKTKDELNNDKNKYGKEITKKLIQNYGTPFYPEDVNNEIYSQDFLNNSSENNNNVDELEYTPVNYLLSSQDSIKNNYIKTINEFNTKKANIENKANNVTINNNYITNNVINNIQSFKTKNQLSIFHFGFNFKSKKDGTINESKPNKETNKIYNLTIFKNSFELSTLKNNEKIDVDIKNKKEIKIDKKNSKLKNDKHINKKLSLSNKNENFSSSSSSSYSHKDKNKKFEKSLSCEIANKKVIPSSSSFSSSSSSSSSSNSIKNENNNKGLKIYKNEGLRFNAEYFNLNQFTNGKFANNVNFRNYIKNIILKKLSNLTHSRIEFSRVKNNIKDINSNRILSPINNKKKSKRFSAIPVRNFGNEKSVKNIIPKNQRSNFISSELYDRDKGNNNSKKKIIKKNNNTNLLNYINQNIQDDNDVLNNPGKFYGGLFNDMMKKYSRVNIKQFKK